MWQFKLYVLRTWNYDLQTTEALAATTRQNKLVFVTIVFLTMDKVKDQWMR